PAALVLQKVIDEKPVRPRQRDRSIPKDLEAICLRAMAKKRARRYPSARDLALDLQRWLNYEPVRARDATRWERSVLWVRRHRPWVIAAGVAAFFLFVAAAA